jgi:hypothetical protein
MNLRNINTSLIKKEIKEFVLNISPIARKKFIIKQFIDIAGYVPNIDYPKSFNEKMQWLKLYYRDPLMTICSDKVQVREYIKNIIGEKYLIPVLGVYNNVEEIDFDKLPNKFVLKVNPGSGYNLICKDKKTLNKQEAIDRLKIWLNPKSNHFFYSYEWSYKNIKPKIICETLINKSKEDLFDYKLYCFNGKAKVILVCSERSQGLKKNYFNTKWNELPFIKQHPRSNKKIPKPNSFKEMIKISEKLASKFPFVRVDLYETNNIIYFGEMTFYPGNGMEYFKPIDWDYKLGDYLKLPKKIKIKNQLDLKNELISLEIKYGGIQTNVPRNKVSIHDPRTAEQIATGGMTGGDRMLHHGYAKYYGKYLHPLLHKKDLTIIEIGILKGSGLAIWSEIFINPKIIGLDIDPQHFYNNYKNLSKLGAFTETKPEIFEFDQFEDNTKYIKKILGKNKIDIIIDDGFHSDHAILNTIKSVKQYLSKEFVYFIEDNDNVHKLIKQKYPSFVVKNYDQLTIINNK